MTASRADERLVLDALADAWSSEIRPIVRINSCILAARAGTAALHYFDVDAVEVAGDMVVFNELAHDLFCQDVPLREWPAEAWSVGTCEGSPGDGYAGHLIIQTDGHLLDLTAYQSHRPHKALLVPDSVIIAVDTVLEVPPWRAWRTESVATFMFRATGDRSYRSAPDWRKGRSQAGLLIRRMRELLPT
jgi:hypothetical protein